MGLDLSSTPGILRILILVLGFIASVCVIYGCDHSIHVRDKNDNLIISCSGSGDSYSCKRALNGEAVQAGAGLIGAVWAATITLVAVSFFTDLPKLVEAIILIIAGILVLIGGSLCLTFGIQISHISGSLDVAFDIGGGVAILNAVLYLTAGILLLLKG